MSLQRLQRSSAEQARAHRFARLGLCGGQWLWSILPASVNPSKGELQHQSHAFENWEPRALGPGRLHSPRSHPPPAAPASRGRARGQVRVSAGMGQSRGRLLPAVLLHPARTPHLPRMPPLSIRRPPRRVPSKPTCATQLFHKPPGPFPPAGRLGPLSA